MLPSVSILYIFPKNVLAAALSTDDLPISEVGRNARNQGAAASWRLLSLIVASVIVVGLTSGGRVKTLTSITGCSRGWNTTSGIGCVSNGARAAASSSAVNFGTRLNSFSAQGGIIPSILLILSLPEPGVVCAPAVCVPVLDRLD